MSSINPWVLLVFAILGELAGTSFMKIANGWEKPWAWAGVAVGFGTAVVLLAYVIQKLDISIAYAIWSGLGILFVAVVGVVVFHESMSWTKALGLLLTIAGIVLLQLETRK